MSTTAARVPIVPPSMTKTLSPGQGLDEDVFRVRNGIGFFVNHYESMCWYCE